MPNRFLVITIAAALTIALPAVAQQRVQIASATLQSAATGNGNGTPLRTTGMGAVALTVNCAGCSGGTTVNFEVSQDGTPNNYAGIGCIASTATTATFVLSTTTAGITLWQCSVAGYQLLRTRISAYSAGTVTVTGTSIALAGQRP